MSKVENHSQVIIELHNKDIKFKKYESNEDDLTNKSSVNKDKNILNKKKFKIISNLKSIKGIYKVPNVKYDDETITMGSGLNNPGINICYMNVIIQVLSHTPFLSAALLKSYHTKICKNYENNIFCVMCIFEKYVKKSYMSSNPLNNPFYNIAIKYIYSKFKFNQQDDSFIFLKYFLDSLSKSCYFSSNINIDIDVNNYKSKINVVNQKSSVDNGSGYSRDKNSNVTRERDKNASEHTNSISESTDEDKATNLNNLIITNDKIMHTFIGYLFGGYFRNVIICNGCGYKSEKVEEFFELSVETTKSNELINLLNDFVVPEQLEGTNKYYCSECKSLQKATKLLSIYKCPQILTIHLKRFNLNVSGFVNNLFNTKSFGSNNASKGSEATAENGSSTNSKINSLKGKLSKLMKRIHFPHHLSISLETTKGKHTWVGYEIYAIVCHLGQSLNSGHYITFIKGKSNFWFLFDDSTVRLVSNEYVKEHESDVYILFYSSVGTSGAIGSGHSGTVKSGKSGARGSEGKSSESSNVSEIDHLLNEYSDTNKFRSTADGEGISTDTKGPERTSGIDGSTDGGSSNGNGDVEDSEDIAHESKGKGDIEKDYEEDNNETVHVLSNFKGKLFNTFVRFRKFKNHKLLTIKLLSNIEHKNSYDNSSSNSSNSSTTGRDDVNNSDTASSDSEDSDSILSDSTITNSTDTTFNDGKSNKRGNRHNNKVNNRGTKVNKCSLSNIFEENEVDAWSDEENKPQIEKYKRLYSSLEPEIDKPNEEEMEYDKGRTRKFKKKVENDEFKAIKHHTGVKIAVSQKDKFDSTANVNNKGISGSSSRKNKFKRKNNGKFKKHT